MREISSVEIPFSAAFCFVHLEDVLGLVFLNRIVHVHDARFAPHARFDDGCGIHQVPVRIRRTAVNRCNHRGHGGRPRRQFHDLQLHSVPLRDSRQIVADPQRQGVACISALCLVDEVDPDIRAVRRLAQEVLAHHAVEIDRRVGSHVSLEIRDLGNRLQIMLEIAGRGVGSFQRRPRRQIEDQEHFILVVVWQLLDPHPARQHKQDAADKQQHHQEQKQPAQPPAVGSAAGESD